MLSAISTPHTFLPYPNKTQFRVKQFAPNKFRVSAVASSSSDPKATNLEYTPWLIVGLGNPGIKYHGTRHNVGFEMIDKISQKQGILLNTIQSKALIGIGSIGEVPILLAKPQAYMNYSGESVYDEMSLPNGVLRLQQKGGHGHHNGWTEGVPSIIHWYRKSTRKYGHESFSLTKIDAALEQGVEAVRTLILSGFSDSITRFNLGQKYKYHKV
ncbi:Chloroplastic group IIB intron splicing facilitator CRS2 chloroplastic [Bienertia sinuspersici]